MVRMSLSLFASLLVLSCLPAQEGRLERVRREVNEEPSGPPPTAGPTSPADNDEASHGSYGSDGSWQENDEDPLGEFVFVGAFYTAYATVAAPFVIPRWLIGDRDWLYFPRHPYDRGHPGYLALDVDASAEAAERWQGRSTPRWWMARVSIEDGNDFNGLNRVGGQVLFDTASRFGVVTNWDHFHESFSLGKRSDVTTIGDITLLCRFAQSEHVLMRAGVGCRIMTDEHTTNAGINLHYGGEWFPCAPWVVTGGIDFGNLGGAFVVRTRASAGVLWHGIEAFGGYDFLRIGDVNLHGPMLGVRFWF